MTSATKAIRRPSRLANPVFWQGLLGIVSFFAVWQGFRWLGFMTLVPSPAEVIVAIPSQISQEGYWQSWIASTLRVMGGFFTAAFLGVVLGISIGMSRKLRYSAFPILEILRPIPPLAWLPIAILFWPTAELTITFLTFIGAFFPIFINVLSGIDSIDARYINAARSLSARPWTLFWKVLVPGALPALFTGLTIAIAITWEVVIAAEMASGNHGLGYLTWNAYMTGSLPGIIVGMLSIGLAGLISSLLMERLGHVAMPWWRK
jgi:NitT/TauT family transport system permease protein